MDQPVGAGSKRKRVQFTEDDAVGADATGPSNGVKHARNSSKFEYKFDAKDDDEFEVAYQYVEADECDVDGRLLGYI